MAVKVGLFSFTCTLQMLKQLMVTLKLNMAKTRSKNNVIVRKHYVFNELDSVSTDNTFSIESFLLEVEAWESF
jgi:hypothetical protein